MTENERELIRLIRENNNPDEAILIAVGAILSVLGQHESCQVQSVAVLQMQA